MQLKDRDTASGYRAIVFFLAIALQIIFIATGDFQSHSSYLSYIACFPILFSILLWIDINMENTIIRHHLKPFPLTTTQSLLVRWNYVLFKRNYWIYIVVIYSSLFLVPNVEIDRKILYIIWSVLQTCIVLLGMIVLNDFLEKRELSRHLLTIPALFILFDSLLSDTDKIYLLINPFFVGCAAVGFLNINNFLVAVLVSGLAFVLLFFSVTMLNKLLNRT